jgi:hypothetical protein
VPYMTQLVHLRDTSDGNLDWVWIETGNFRLQTSEGFAIQLCGCRMLKTEHWTYSPRRLTLAAID